MRSSLYQQVDRLSSAGYPTNLVVSVAERLKKQLSKVPSQGDLTEKDREKVVVIPYIHNVSPRLKKVGRRGKVNVVFSAPNKLGALCKRVNGGTREPQSCSVNHKNRFVECNQGVVYSIPFVRDKGSVVCDKEYVGQTGRCTNDRLREQDYNVTRAVSGHLGIHCRDCGCLPDFTRTRILARHKDKTVREIIEAAEIARLREHCVSAPSVALTHKELAFMRDFSCRR